MKNEEKTSTLNELKNEYHQTIDNINNPKVVEYLLTFTKLLLEKWVL